MSKYSIGLDFGTNSARALIVDVATGEEVATSVWPYHRGEAGVILDPNDPQVARQHPREYVDGIEGTVRRALELARERMDLDPADVIGIGVDTTGSTPLPVDDRGRPLAFHDEFHDNLDAMAWLWKDHAAYAEAERITESARRLRPHYLSKCGGTYSCEWFWSKVLHCLNAAPEVFKATHTWVECADYIPALLTGTTAPERIRRCACAAGHKAMFSPSWGGFPDEEFLGSLAEGLVRVRRTLPEAARTIADAAGTLTEEWAHRLGLPVGIPVAVAGIDAHLGAVGCGIRPGVLAMVLGTSSCDMMVHPLDRELADIPGLCGIVPGSILPGAYGLEAGQAAVGDIFNWYVNYIRPGGETEGSHEDLTRAAEALTAGQSGLLALDWHNGNRNVLADQRLTGLLVGMTLRTTPAEIYRALIEATAFGARRIIERFEEYGLAVERVVACGGIPSKNPLVMQILADSTGRTIEVARSEQASALGAAMAGAVVAGRAAGGHGDFAEAARAMCGVREARHVPDPDSARVYERLYKLYLRLHDLFGTRDYAENQFGVMKELLAVRDDVRG